MNLPLSFVTEKTTDNPDKRRTLKKAYTDLAKPGVPAV
jgi:hypothetical protein